jgi:hypothetical protein
MNISAEKLVLDIKAALLHRRIVRPQIGYGSILLLDFSNAEMDISTSEKGDVYMRVECSWRIELDDGVLIACEDDRNKLRECVGTLGGRTVEGVEVSVPGLDVRISLSVSDLRRPCGARELDDWHT